MSEDPTRSPRSRWSHHRAVTVAVTAAMLLAVLTMPVHARQDDAPPATDEAPTFARARQLIVAEQYAAAAEMLREITLREPENGQAWFFLGFALHGDGDLDQALPAHLMAAEFPQVAPTAMYNIACVYSLKNKPDKAFAWLERAAEAGFRRADALSGDPDLANIRKDERWEPFFKTYARPAGLLAMTKEQADARRRNRASTADEPSNEDAPAEAEDLGEPGAGIGALASSVAAGPTTRIAALEPTRRLDFWVGTWDVFDATGVRVGTNRIEPRLDGHLIFEDWTSERGGRGQSMNYFDPSKSKWVQVWVDGEGGIIVQEGRFSDGTMRHEGRHILADGTVRPFRSSLSPNPDGSIRQLIEESTDDDATWGTWFDGRYVRQDAATR